MDYKEWTNTAQFPSRLLDRPLTDSISVAEQIGVPKCASTRIALKSRLEDGQAITMTSEGGFSKGVDFAPDMTMSFAKNGRDYAQPQTVVAPGVQAIGRLHTYECEGQTVHVAHWPNCQNLSLVERAEPSLPAAPAWLSQWGPADRLSNGPSGEVPLTGTLALVLIGILALAYFRRGNQTTEK